MTGGPTPDGQPEAFEAGEAEALERDWGTETAYCPECGAGSLFDGMSSETPCWLCAACGHQWAAVPLPELSWAEEAEAMERAWEAWNTPALMEQRAAQAEPEAEAIWQESRTELNGAPQAEPEAGL